MTAEADTAPRTAGEPGYIMEHGGESRRLEQKTDHVATARQLIAAGLRSGMTAADVGCGSGAVTRIMAGQCGARRAVGIDGSADRVTEARARATGLPADFTVGDATRLPLADAAFEFTWSRFLFEYLPEPRAALAEMIRVTRPGGTVAVADLDGQITGFHPLDAEVRDGLDRLLAALAETGFDPYVGRKLYPWFTAAGLADVRVDVRPYQVYAGGIPASDWPNWEAKLRTITALLADRTGERSYWHWFRDAMAAELHRPDLFYHCTLVTVTGRRPD